jgi:hypothetical protein
MYTKVTFTGAIVSAPGSNNAAGQMVASSPPAGYVGCPTSNAQLVTASNGEHFNIPCNSRTLGGSLIPPVGQNYNATSCMNLCATTATCTSWVLTDHSACQIYSGYSPTFIIFAYNTAGIISPFPAPPASSSLLVSSSAVDQSLSILMPSSSLSDVPSSASSPIPSSTSSNLATLPSGVATVTASNGDTYAVVNNTASGSPNHKVKRQVIAVCFLDCINQCSSTSGCQEITYDYSVADTSSTRCTLSTVGFQPPAPNSAVSQLIGTAATGVNIPACIVNLLPGGTANSVSSSFSYSSASYSYSVGSSSVILPRSVSISPSASSSAFSSAISMSPSLSFSSLPASSISALSSSAFVSQVPSRHILLQAVLQSPLAVFWYQWRRIRSLRFSAPVSHKIFSRHP